MNDTGKGKICPVCEKHIFREPDAFDFCPVCGWCDDGLQSDDHDYERGYNGISVNQAKKIYKEKGRVFPECIWDKKKIYEALKENVGKGRMVRVIETLEIHSGPDYTGVIESVTNSSKNSFEAASVEFAVNGKRFHLSEIEGIELSLRNLQGSGTEVI